MSNFFQETNSVAPLVANNEKKAVKPVKKHKQHDLEKRNYVKIAVIFLKIGEIDTIKEQYSADVFIQSKWREPLLDNKSPEELKRADLRSMWNPSLYIENELSAQKDATWQSASTNERGEAYIGERRKLRGTFVENLELYTFPLDVQDLSVKVVSEREDSEVVLVPEDEDPSTINVGTFADAQEWRLYNFVEVEQSTVKVEFANHEHTHSALKVTCRAGRRPGFFYYNVFLVKMFISSMSFTTFSVDSKLPQNRLSLTFTLLLTSIAFKMAMNQTLPKISYLTYMDRYVLLSIAFLVFVCLWHAIVPSINKEAPWFYKENIEVFVMVGFFLIYIVGHIIFITYIYVQAGKKRREMKQKETESMLRHHH